MLSYCITCGGVVWYQQNLHMWLHESVYGPIDHMPLAAASGYRSEYVITEEPSLDE